MGGDYSDPDSGSRTVDAAGQAVFEVSPQSLRIYELES